MTDSNEGRREPGTDERGAAPGAAADDAARLAAHGTPAPAGLAAASAGAARAGDVPDEVPDTAPGSRSAPDPLGTGGETRGSRTTARVRASLAKRYAAERRFRWYGIVAIGASLGFLVVLLGSIVTKGTPAFSQTFLKLQVTLDADALGVAADATPNELRRGDYGGLVKAAMRERFPDVDGRSEKRELYALVSSGAEFQIGRRVAADPSLIGQTVDFWVPADDELGALVKRDVDLANPDSFRTRLSEAQIGMARELRDTGELDVRFNTTFFTNGDSREPELAGIRAALVGSAFTLLITFVLSFPIAVAAAIYLEEFAPQNRWTDIVEVNINNLAAVPSIVFGLLGLAVFINFFALPRSAPIVGGIVLSLMTLPTIIISSRASLKSVPPSIREAARGIGASPLQVVFHHVLPLAMPGILTGTIIGLAQALGETAPLLMIGMVAFIVDVPQSVTDAATVLPVQVFLWADSPERAFVEKTSAAIMVLLAFLIVMNAVAVLLRKRFERRW